jgi:effector-binding domain-containing protein
MLNGQSTWDDGFKTLNSAFVKLNDTLAKANIHSAGNPMAVFTETDDAGFKFSAMVPIDKAPDGKPNVDPQVAFGNSPGGKVMKFQHRSAYDDIDSTYEAITAYLDEKGLEAKNLFAEEYLNRTKSPDDPSLEVDIYVFLK